MSAVRTTAALVIIAMGSIALVTGDFGIEVGWVTGFGLAAIGIAGLISAVSSSRNSPVAGE